MDSKVSECSETKDVYGVTWKLCTPDPFDELASPQSRLPREAFGHVRRHQFPGLSDYERPHGLQFLGGGRAPETTPEAGRARMRDAWHSACFRDA